MDEQEFRDSVELLASKLREWRDWGSLKSLTGTVPMADGELVITAHEDGSVIAVLDEQIFDLTLVLKEA